MNENADRSSLELLVNVSRELARSLDIREVLPRVLTLSVNNVGAERGTLIVLDEKGVAVDAAIVINGQLVSTSPHQLQPTLDHGLAGRVLRTGQPALIDDTSADNRWLQREDDDRQRTGPKSAICIPLVSGENPVGVLTLVHPTPHYFKTEHLELLQAIADEASIAIAHALLYASLEAATRRYRVLFEENINPLILTTMDGRILEINRAASTATGYNLEELVDQPLDLLEPAVVRSIRENGEELAGGATVRFEGEITARDGTKWPAEIYVVQTNLNGQDCLQWMARDITEKRELDRLRDDLTAMVFHDLRAPLSNVISSLDILKMLLERHEEETIGPVFDIARRSADRLQRLIDSLLDINRLEAGQPILNKKASSIPTLIEDAVDIVQSSVESRKQSIQVSVGADLPLVMIDPDMILRVIVNLLENATKFTPAGGAIGIGASSTSDKITIWIDDNGPGIPPEDRRRIFEKYGRLLSDRFTKGVGLGLAFCRLAVQAHGGKIWVEGIEDSGSRFIFELPLIIG